MEYQGAEYFGALLLSDAATCRKVYDVLIQHRGKTIQELGNIDLAYLSDSTDYSLVCWRKQGIEKAKPKQKAAPAQRKRKTASSDS